MAKKYFLKFKTLNHTFNGGDIGSSTLMVKEHATDRIISRKIARLDDAWIEDETGTVYAVLNMAAYRKHVTHTYEWLTVHA